MITQLKKGHQKTKSGGFVVIYTSLYNEKVTKKTCLQDELLGFLGRGKRILDLENTLEMNTLQGTITYPTGKGKSSTQK